MARLYQDNGFLDFDVLEEKAACLNLVIGPRNSGKTYSALLHQRGRTPFVFLRTAKTQIDLVFSEEMSPFNKINRDRGSRFFCAPISKSGLIGIYDDFVEDDKGRLVPDGDLVGYCLALSQIGATRGFNLDNVETLIYDEFVLHPGESTRFAKRQFTMYADLVFTLNRARELEGRPAIRQWLLGNSDDLTNDILQGLQVVDTIIGMRRSGQNYVRLPDRDIAIFLLDDSPVAKRLNDTGALSRIFKGSDYLDMAYGNRFIYDDDSDCQRLDLHGYAPDFVWDGLVFYRHKRQSRYYVRRAAEGAAFSGIRTYSGSSRDTINAREDHAHLYYYYLDCLITFESYSVKARFFELYDIDK